MDGDVSNWIDVWYKILVRRSIEMNETKINDGF